MPVTLTHAYYMGVTEVTQRQYELIMGENPSFLTSCGGDCPVERVWFDDAADFLNRLSREEGLMECYDCGPSRDCVAAVNPYECDGYRLPTEAEWEGAARCGEDLLYAGSNNASEVAWFADTSGYASHPVGLLLPNACGLYDMSGNVWEWTQDWFDENYYSDAGRTDPVGGTSEVKRVTRGGSLSGEATDLRVARRMPGTTSNAYDPTGFRVVRTIP